MAAQRSKARAIQVGIAQASGTRHRTQERCTPGHADQPHPRLPPDRSIVRWATENRLQRGGNRGSSHGGGRSRHVRPGGEAGSTNRASRSDPALQVGGATRVDTGAPPPNAPSLPRTRGVRIRGRVFRRWPPEMARGLHGSLACDHSSTVDRSSPPCCWPPPGPARFRRPRRRRHQVLALRWALS